jgi:hypothetical protein
MRRSTGRLFSLRPYRQGGRDPWHNRFDGRVLADPISCYRGRLIRRERDACSAVQTSKWPGLAGCCSHGRLTLSSPRTGACSDCGVESPARRAACALVLRSPPDPRMSAATWGLIERLPRDRQVHAFARAFGGAVDGHVPHACSAGRGFFSLRAVSDAAVSCPRPPGTWISSSITRQYSPRACVRGRSA